jgi:hypothetical protein
MRSSLSSLKICDWDNECGSRPVGRGSDCNLCINDPRNGPLHLAGFFFLRTWISLLVRSFLVDDGGLCLSFFVNNECIDIVVLFVGNVISARNS